MKFLLSSKIHKAIVSYADIEYEGSIGIDAELMRRVGILDGEKVLIVSNKSGERIETYAIPENEKGRVAIYGAAAHKIKKGDEIIIMGFSLDDEPIKARKILVDKNNNFVRYL